MLQLGGCYKRSAVAACIREQMEHQDPRLMLFGIAFQRCPLEHSHNRWVFALMYSLDKHLPPFSAAISLISCSVNLRAFPLSDTAQRGHQCPLSITYDSVSHSCPSRQQNRRRPRLLRYPEDKHLPPCAEAISRITRRRSRTSGE